MKVPPKIMTVLAAAAIVVAATVPYVSTWSDAFIADDWAHLQHSKLLTLPIFINNCSFSSDDMFYRPVAIAYFYLNYLLFGVQPAGYHVMKAALFAATAVLLFFLMRRLTGSRPAGFVAGLVFALHPINVSCAVWIATHANVLCAFFYVLSLLLFLEARKRPRARGAWYAAFVASLLLCLGSYELGYTLPAALLLVELLFISRESGLSAKQYLAKAWVWNAPYLAIAAAFLSLRLFHMGLISAATGTLGYRVLQGFRGMLVTLFMPVGRVESDMTLEVRILPLIAGALLFVCALIFGGKFRRPAIFAAALLIIGAIPAMNGFAGIPDFRDARFVIITMLGFSVLAGVCFAMAWRWLAGKIVASICIAAILAAYTVLTVGQVARWSVVAAQSDAVITAVAKTCEGKSFPFRLVFITYPYVPGTPHYTEPLAIIAALEVKYDIYVPPEFHIGSPYAKVVYRPDLLKPELKESVKRCYPLRLAAGAEYQSSAWTVNESLPPLKGADLQKTYFFYWDGKELHDCTTKMVARLLKDRRQPLPPTWTADEKYPYKDVKVFWCDFDPFRGDGLLYITPWADKPDASPAIVIDCHNVNSAQIDAVEIVMSAASKANREGYFTGKVTWTYTGEKETQEVLARAEPFFGRYYAHHEVENMARYRIPLAHRFMQAGDRGVSAIYIILPRLPECAIREIRLIRFDE